MRIEGSFVALITPFNADGSVSGYGTVLVERGAQRRAPAFRRDAKGKAF